MKNIKTAQLRRSWKFTYQLRNIGLISTDGKFQDIGPVRVDTDRAGASHYIKLEDEYKTTITRTDDFVTIKWDFPEGEYKMIDIIRFTHPVTERLRGNSGKSVVSTVEKKLQYTDALPDPNSEYWYWFLITMKSGAIIYRGPIKAEYGNQ